jgi:hypothetical protein
MMLTYNGVQTPFPVLVNVVPAAVGIYTLTSSGLGPGVFTALDYSVTTFTTAAKTGDVITAWATGLGPISGPDNVLPQTFPNFPGVEVFVGTQPAKVIYAGRSGCCSAVDQISFELPQGITGCYIPVAVRSGGKISNFVSIAANSSGGACADTAPTIPTSLVNSAIAGQPVKTAAIAIGPVSVLRGIGFNQRQVLAQRLSELMHVKVSEQDVAALLHAMQTHNQRALGRTMRKYAASWRALDATGKATIRAHLNLNQEGAAAGFGQYSTPAVLASAIGGLFPSQGSCSIVLPISNSVQASSQGLDAGPSLNLSGAAGSWTLTSTGTGQYQVLFGSTPAGPNVPPGVYAIGGSGGKNVGAFNAMLNIGGNIVWTNKSAISTVDRTQPLTVTWSGGASPGYVLLGGYAEGDNQGIIEFACAEDASKGSFTIPAFILSTLYSTAARGGMFIGPHPLSRQLTIPGIDLAYFIDGSSDSKSVAYR